MRVVCLLVMALLAGCGQRGPLYFPKPQQPAKAAPPAQSAPADQAASDKKKDADKQKDDSNGN